MATLAELMATLGLDTTGFDRGLGDSYSRARSFQGDVNSSFGQVGVGAIALGTTISSAIVGAFNMATTAVAGFSRQALGQYEQYERLQMSLQSLTARELVNSGAATDLARANELATVRTKELIDWVEKLAIESPFKQSDVAGAFRMAMAYGFTTEEAQRLTQATIDFASGSGAGGEAMGRIALALGQIKAKGQLAGQEVLQLTNAGLDVRGILAQAFGVTTEELIKMQEKGLIPADKAIQAIVSSLEKDFGGSAKRQANTFSGLLSSLSDLKEVSLRNVFSGVFKEVQPYFQSFVGMVTDPTFQEGLKTIGVNFGKSAGAILEWLSQLLPGIEYLTKWLLPNLRIRFGTAFGHLDLTPIKDAFIAVFGDLGKDFKGIDFDKLISFKNAQALIKFFDDISTKIAQVDWMKLFGDIRQAMQDFWDYISGIDWVSVRESIVKFFDDIKGKFEGVDWGALGLKVRDAFVWMGEELPGFVSSATTAISGLMSVLAPLINFATQNPDLIAQFFVGFSVAKTAGSGLFDFASGLIPTLASLGQLVQAWPAIQTAFAGLPALLAPLGALFSGALAGIGSAIAGVISVLVPFIPLIIGIVLAITAIYLMWENNTWGFRDRIIEIWNNFAEPLGAVMIFIVGIIDSFKTMFMGVWEGIVQYFNGIVRMFTGLWQIFSGIFSGNGNLILTGLQNLFGGLIDTFTGLIKIILALIIGLGKMIVNGFLGVLSGIAGLIAGAVVNVTEGVQKFFDDVSKFWGEIEWDSLGENIINGIIEGLKAGWEWLSKALSDMSTDIIDFVKAQLGIESPSKVFMEIGTNINKGFANGLSGSSYLVREAMYVPGVDDVSRFDSSVAGGGSKGESVNKYYGNVTLDLSGRDAQLLLAKATIR